ncbi:[acyl-carrier-protein] S-malonyltransferase [Oribacterium sp. oral taxon 078 str. F0262]|uniref:ACP S-malonyltransferase n=1 Tax=Oribacterium sp. oral taxon 078 TaxID=652706 RepID=UPI0001BCBD9D|nr:ACP S-malonyltransferase [Oribacterium sp. oral taxon 078]EFE92502.1 [acyl-carrier-protein] S-malonyltransferase [Oribacterium sp. oral taxon 078 str. F0262]
MSIAFLYAGQGSQHAGMGKDLYESYPEFREVYEGIELPFDLRRLSFEDPEGLIHETKYTQPALVAFACGVTAILRGMGFRADYAAGLSLGEYSALSYAGSIDARTAVQLAAFRGDAMQRASQGIACGMSAVLGLSEEKLSEACERASEKGLVSICNYNCPGQLVIGGESEAVEEAGRIALELGAKRVIPLKVSGPFHTALMKSAGDALSEYFKKIHFKTPECTVLYNFLGRERREGDPEIPELLIEQVQKPVRMESILRELLGRGVRSFYEIGPGRTLSGFVKKTAKAMEIEEIEITSLETAEEIEALRERMRG